MPSEITKHFKRERRFHPQHCAHGSFRMKQVGDSGTRIVLCCPVGRWSRKGRCKTSMRVQSILKPR